MLEQRDPTEMDDDNLDDELDENPENGSITAGQVNMANPDAWTVAIYRPPTIQDDAQ